LRSEAEAFAESGAERSFVAVEEFRRDHARHLAREKERARAQDAGVREELFGAAAVRGAVITLELTQGAATVAGQASAIESGH
jgi:hypothetical protein